MVAGQACPRFGYCRHSRHGLDPGAIRYCLPIQPGNTVLICGYSSGACRGNGLFPAQGVAASLERAFPELDNHLINYIQFSRDTSDNPFKKAYVGGAQPQQYRKLKLRRMKNRKAHIISQSILAAVLLLLVSPTIFMGRSWGVALWRSVNPFTNTPPASLTRILEVTPGNTTVVQGGPVLLICRVQGRRDHEVWVDVDLADADKSIYTLGHISTGEPLTFSHRIPRVTTPLRYRFRAGDAPEGNWHTVDTRPPSAFTDIKLSITPPSYTRGKRQVVSGWDEAINILQGSTANVAAVCNVPLKSLALQSDSADPLPLRQTDASGAWQAILTISGGHTLRLTAEDLYGDTLVQTISYACKPDAPPVIEILEPAGLTILAPGVAPKIEFSVVDDHGIADVRVEQVKVGSSKDTAGDMQKRWHPENTLLFDGVWKGSAQKEETLVYRIVASDNRPGEPQTARSVMIIFNADTHKTAADKRNALEAQAFESLNKVVELQRQNVSQTKRGRSDFKGVPAAFWDETASQQQKIRDLTKTLLTNPVNPLGTLTSSIKKLYLNEMAEAITRLSAIPRALVAQKSQHASRALIIEESILRQLTRAGSAASNAKVERRMSGLMAMLQKLIDGEARVLKQTGSVIEQHATPGSALIDAQDDLAADLTEFTAACRRESGEVQANDATYAAVLTEIAERCKSETIREDMIMAAERLDENQATDAAPLETSALAKLKALDAFLNAVETQEMQAEHEAMVEGVQQAKEKLNRIKELHKRMLEAMELVRDQKDKSDDERFDMMEEEFTEIIKNTKESLLEVPTDLHVFMDLNVANDIVEDVFGVFQEVEQAFDKKESDAAPDGDFKAREEAYAKEEALLDMMEEAEDRLDDMEMWLRDKPDDVKVTTETLDREEMPEEGIALGALAAQVEDLIGELLEEDEEEAAEADDGATTHAMGDWESGWDVMEGNISSFGAKGKAGNETPDHKEQDGRSNVGRQGMAVGETAAGSGTIGEGDKNIEERRTADPTQSGQVNLDGEADTKATGGGKLATGKADDLGMSGGVKRMDSNEAGSWEGMASLMARQADAVFAKASMKNIRVDSLQDAAHHLRQSSDAVAKGNIRQVKEFRKLAIASLQQAQAQLTAGPAAGFAVESSPGVLGNVMDSGPDLAPEKYRNLVADYYKRLNETL